MVLRQNQIVSVGPRIFANCSSLWYIDLSSNLLQDLDKRWIYEVGSNGNASLPAQVNLQHNRISKFTNLDGLKLQCGMKRMYAMLDLRYNEIRQLSDAVEGWQLTVRRVLCIAPFVMSRSTVHVDVSHNPFLCDCKDYQLYWMDANFHFFRLFKEARCAEPLSLRDREIGQIPLDRFVCELTERCPLGCRCLSTCKQRSPRRLFQHKPHGSSTGTAAMTNNHDTYALDFSSNSRLRQLERREYFHNASVIDVSNCALTKITSWREVFRVKSVYLHGNRLTYMPRFIASLNVSTKDFSLHNNPWRCSCDDRWMAEWLRVVSKRVSLRGVVLCESPARLRGKNMMQITDEEFCVDPVTKALAISMSSVVGLAIILLSVCVVIYRLRVKLYSRWKFHPFDSDECPGEDMDYDMFFCCSSEDHEPKGRGILETVEANGYRVCYHYRDFMPGLIIDNIEASVTRSKRTVCLVTGNFIRRFALSCGLISRQHR